MDLRHRFSSRHVRTKASLHSCKTYRALVILFRDPVLIVRVQNEKQNNELDSLFVLHIATNLHCQPGNHELFRGRQSFRNHIIQSKFWRIQRDNKGKRVDRLLQTSCFPSDMLSTSITAGMSKATDPVEQCASYLRNALFVISRLHSVETKREYGDPAWEIQLPRYEFWSLLVTELSRHPSGQGGPALALSLLSFIQLSDSHFRP